MANGSKQIGIRKPFDSDNETPIITFHYKSIEKSINFFIDFHVNICQCKNQDILNVNSDLKKGLKYYVMPGKVSPFATTNHWKAFSSAEKTIQMSAYIRDSV